MTRRGYALALAIAAHCAFTVSGAARAGDTRPATAHRATLGKEVFTKVAQPSCTVCHTLRDAGSTGTVGPPLDDLDVDVERVVAAVRNGVGAMPAYAEVLTDAQIQAVANYVARATGSP